MRKALSVPEKANVLRPLRAWKAPTKWWLGNLKHLRLSGDIVSFDGRDAKSGFRLFHPVLTTQVRRPRNVLRVWVGGKAEPLRLAVHAYPTRKTQRFAPGFSAVTDLVGPGLRGPPRFLLRGQQPDSNTKRINVMLTNNNQTTPDHPNAPLARLEFQCFKSGLCVLAPV